MTLAERALTDTPVDAKDGGVPIFENITLAPGFSPDPQVLHGFSGGVQTAQTTAGQKQTQTGLCVGFVDEQPDHQLTLTEFFEYLRIEVRSAQDTSIVIRGPGGSWCNDNYSNFNPGLAGQWFSGIYDIWIGSPQGNQYHPYIIMITTQQPPSQTPNSPN